MYFISPSFHCDHWLCEKRTCFQSTIASPNVQNQSVLITLNTEIYYPLKCFSVFSLVIGKTHSISCSYFFEMLVHIIWHIYMYTCLGVGRKGLWSFHKNLLTLNKEVVVEFLPKEGAQRWGKKLNFIEWSLGACFARKNNAKTEVLIQVGIQGIWFVGRFSEEVR